MVQHGGCDGSSVEAVHTQELMVPSLCIYYALSILWSGHGVATVTDLRAEDASALADGGHVI